MQKWTFIFKIKILKWGNKIEIRNPKQIEIGNQIEIRNPKQIEIRNYKYEGKSSETNRLKK